MAKSTKSGRSGKPKKPYADFPMTPHLPGRWCKKIRGKLHYFGSWKDDRDGVVALERLNCEWPFLKEGRTPPPVASGDGCTVQVLANSFLDSKRQKMVAGELAASTFDDYYRSCRNFISHCGEDRLVDDLRPDDFESFRAKLVARVGTVALRNDINHVRILLKLDVSSDVSAIWLLDLTNFAALSPTKQFFNGLLKAAQEKLLELGLKVRDENGLARKMFPLQGDITSAFTSLLDAKANRDILGVDEFTQKLWSQGIGVRFVPAKKGIPIRMAKGAFRVKLGRKQQG